MIINNKRALAYNAKIKWVKPIEGANNIELVGVNGWTCVAKIGEFKAGDTCIYFEIDSKLPEAEWSSFMANKQYKVKTMKLSKFGVVSQGLALPLSAFGVALAMKLLSDISLSSEATVDFTEFLGIKYSVQEDNIRKADTDRGLKEFTSKHKKFFKNPFVKRLMKYTWFRNFIRLFAKKKKHNDKAFPTNFPCVHKTDEERIENLPHLLAYPYPLIVTEKLDGTSCTYILERKPFNKFEFYVTSRNVRQLAPGQKCYHESNIYWELAAKYKIEERLREYLNSHPNCSYVCIQGEGVGNVQGNPLKLKENDLYIFNFIDSINGRFNSVEGKAIIEQWGMKWVPILDTHYKMPDTMEAVKAHATAKSAVNPEVLREGVVLRDPTNDLSFKNVSIEYLLRHHE